LGFGPLAFAAEADGPQGFEMVSFAGHERKPRSFPVRYRALLAACALLAVTLVAAPIVSTHLALAVIEEEAARLKPQAEQAAKLKGARDTQVALLTKAIALKRAAPSPLALLARLSEALDDQSFLAELRLEGTALTLSGLSSDASGLAQRLGGMPDFKAVKFSGPVTRDAGGARDRFTLVLELRPQS
jgi:hypothetical protein